MKIKSHCIVFFSLATYFLGAIFLSAANLPDYMAYKDMFSMNGTDGALSGNSLFSVFVVQFFNSIDFSYENFRVALSVISITLVIFSIVLLKNYSGWVSFRRKTNVFDVLLSVVVFFSILVFALEFFSVRIRAGFSISLFLVAFSFWFTRKEGVLRVYLSILFFYLSINVHFLTAVTLFSFLLLPTILFFLANHLKFFLGRKLLFSKLLFMAFCIGVVFLAGILLLAPSRGAHLNSDLNFVRLLALTVIPLIIIFVGFSGDSKTILSGLNIKNCTFQTNRNNKITCYLLKDSWISFVSIVYAGFSLSLLVLYFLGYINTAGEAIVRVYTLSSVVSVLIISISNNKLNYFWVFLLFSNSLFFMNTLFF